MPFKSESIKIQGTKHDRRVKLTLKQKEDIRHEYLKGGNGVSQRDLAKRYGVSRRLIVFCIYPERLKQNYQNRVENGGSSQYYDKDKHTKSMREHRAYKQELKGIICSQTV